MKPGPYTINQSHQMMKIRTFLCSILSRPLPRQRQQSLSSQRQQPSTNGRRLSKMICPALLLLIVLLGSLWCFLSYHNDIGLISAYDLLLDHLSADPNTGAVTTTTSNEGKNINDDKNNNNNNNNNSPSTGSTESLKLSDFIVHECLGRGSVNVAVLATLPDCLAQKTGLWDADHNKPRKLVLKYIDTREYGHAEIESFESIMAIDKAKADAVGLMQAVWAARDVPNPYYCKQAAGNVLRNSGGRRWDDEACIKEGAWPKVENFSSKAFQRMRSMEIMDVLVLPHFDEHYITKTAKNIMDVKIFFRSMLEQLSVAHEAGANNIDLQVDRNMFVDPKGRAILFDWNGNIPVGNPAHDPHQIWSIAAPEAWLESAYGYKARIMPGQVHAMDTWQAGIVLLNFVYYPCSWTSARVLKEGRSSEKKEFLRELIRALGGNTIIPVNNKESVDLRELAGLEPIPHAKQPDKFTPLLGSSRRTTCKEETFYLDDHNVTDADKKSVLDLVQKMLAISPVDRPTMAELLQHPFLQIDDEQPNSPANAAVTH